MNSFSRDVSLSTQVVQIICSGTSIVLLLLSSFDQIDTKLFVSSNGVEYNGIESWLFIDDDNINSSF